MKAKNSSKNNKFLRFSNKRSAQHFTAQNKITSDVLGSYTGVPEDITEVNDITELYPTQDADDL